MKLAGVFRTGDPLFTGDFRPSSSRTFELHTLPLHPAPHPMAGPEAWSFQHRSSAESCRSGRSFRPFEVFVTMAIRLEAIAFWGVDLATTMIIVLDGGSSK